MPRENKNGSMVGLSNENTYCDNISRCHNPITIGEDQNALRWFCKECKSSGVIRKDWRGIPEKREYSRVYKKEILQGNDNLFYKYNDRFLRK